MKGKSRSPLVKGDTCFVCGQNNPDGMRLKFDIDETKRTAACRLTIPEKYRGWDDIAHGGIIATLLDEACVHAARTLGPLPVTAQLTVSYKKPVRLETEIALFGEVVQRNRRLVESRARLEIAGTIHAEATAKVVLLES